MFEEFNYLYEKHYDWGYVKIVERHGNLVTFELEYPYIIHAQMMTHRMFSRNAMSSRAMPTKKFIQMVRDYTYVPEFKANKPGMQPGEVIENEEMARNMWLQAKAAACTHAEFLVEECGVHKQWANRMVMPFAPIRVIVTATEWDNFFKLRRHGDAQDEIRWLADAMYEAMEECPDTPKRPNNHLPYITPEEFEYFGEGDIVSLISAARCARVSYNRFGAGVDFCADFQLAKKLLEAGHLSPFEHQAVRDQFDVGSNNFKGWVQYRYELAKAPILPGEWKLYEDMVCGQDQAT